MLHISRDTRERFKNSAYGRLNGARDVFRIYQVSIAMTTCTRRISPERNGGEEKGERQREMSMTIRVRNQKMPICRVTDRNGYKDCGEVAAAAAAAVVGRSGPLKEFVLCLP